MPPALRVRAPAARRPACGPGCARPGSLSFASQEDLELMGDTDAIGVANPLQADEACLRTSLAPGLLRAAARNRARGVRAVGAVRGRHRVPLGRARRGTRGWPRSCCTGVGRRGVGRRPPRPLDALDAKGVLEALMDELRIHGGPSAIRPGAPIHPGRSAIGPGRRRSRSASWASCTPGAPRRSSSRAGSPLAELDVPALWRPPPRPASSSRDVPRFPPVRRDLAFVVPRTRRPAPCRPRSRPRPATCWARACCSTCTGATPLADGHEEPRVRRRVPRAGPHPHRRGGRPRRRGRSPSGSLAGFGATLRAG